MTTINFKENQHFKELPIFILIGLVQLIFLWGFIKQIVFDLPWGIKPASDLALIIINLGILLFILFLASFNLKTAINENCISFKFSPLQINMRTIHWKQVKSVRISKYDGIKEYWGYGLRYMPGKGWCYTMPGKYAIKLFLNNGRRILIGTHMPEEISQILHDLKNNGIIELLD
jgi:hypothetical protein